MVSGAVGLSAIRLSAGHLHQTSSGPVAHNFVPSTVRAVIGSGPTSLVLGRRKFATSVALRSKCHKKSTVGPAVAPMTAGPGVAEQGPSLLPGSRCRAQVSGDPSQTLTRSALSKPCPLRQARLEDRTIRYRFARAGWPHGKAILLRLKGHRTGLPKRTNSTPHHSHP